MEIFCKQNFSDSLSTKILELAMLIRGRVTHCWQPTFSLGAANFCRSSIDGIIINFRRRQFPDCSQLSGNQLTAGLGHGLWYARALIVDCFVAIIDRQHATGLAF